MVRATQSTLMDAGETSLVKLFDLLTNRYHVGIVRASGDEALYIEMPASAHLWQGQCVRFVVADGRGLVEKRSMRRACITHVLPEGATHLNVRLEAVADSALN